MIWLSNKLGLIDLVIDLVSANIQESGKDMSSLALLTKWENIHVHLSLTILGWGIT